MAIARGCDPFFRTLGLIALGCTLIVGLAPTPRTVTVLGLGLAAVFTVILLRRSWRTQRLLLREDDGRLWPLGLVVFSGLVAPVFVVLLIGQFLFGTFTPPVQHACLCTRVGGLVNAGVIGTGLVFLSGMLAGLIVASVSMVARMRLEYRQNRRPRH